MKRTPLKQLIGKTIKRISEKGNYYSFLDEDGKVIFTVSCDHLFDKAGFRFQEIYTGEIE